MTSLAPLPRAANVKVWHYQGDSSSRAGLRRLEPAPDELLLSTSDDFPGVQREIGAYAAGTVLVFGAFETTHPDVILRSDDDLQALISGSWDTDYRIDWETIPASDPTYDGDFNDQVTIVSLVDALRRPTVGGLGFGV